MFISYLRSWMVLASCFSLFAGGLRADLILPERFDPPEEVLEENRDLLERMLQENIMPFWDLRFLDKEHGGYLMNHDERGEFEGPADKGIISQARMVWYYSRLVSTKRGDILYLDYARHGYQFLRDKMWDKEFGGFYWTVDPTGEKAVADGKHLYGNAFGLYALSEFHRASGDEEALELAKKLFGLMEDHGHDAEFGGYLESFARDWTPTPPGEWSLMGKPGDAKLMNTHLHLLEAFATFHEVSGEETARERLIELINIQSNAVVRKGVVACTDVYRRDWEPVLSGEYGIVSYGHDLENVWLLMEALGAVDQSSGPFVDLYEALYDYSLKWGRDEDGGGFYYSGPINAEPTNRDKSVWVQSEALVSSLKMFERTGKKEYWDLFQDQLRYVDTVQVDWENGGWHTSVGENGRRGGSKANQWRAPYHNGRAVMECLGIVEEMLGL